MLTSNVLEVVISASLTVNVCVVFYVGLPCIFKAYQDDKELASSLRTTVPVYVSRLCSSLPFYLILPVCSVILIFTSNVLYDPFFVFDHSLRIVFSISLGQYIYKIAECIYWHKKINYKPVLIHHTVVVGIFSVIIYYEQCTVIGLVGLLLKGSFAFAEFDYDRLSKILKKRNSSCTLMVLSTVVFLVAIILKGLVPAFLILFSVARYSGELLSMQYIPLAFFFLSLVFFSAVSGWFIKDAFYCLKDMLYCQRSKELTQFQAPSTVINHQGLVQLIQGSNGAAIVRCNDLWEKDLNSLCSAHALQSKMQNHDVIEIEAETPTVLKTTNLMKADNDEV